MGFAWAGVQQYMDQKREERLISEERQQKRKDFIFQLMLPELIKRRQKFNELRQKKESVYRKGLNLFGEDVANTLENMGELESVVSQYESTEGGKDWANLVSVRTEKFLKGMLESDNEAQRQSALRLIERGSYLGDASEAEKSDYLTELSVAGVLDEEELMNLELETNSGATYTGPIPDLGKFDVFTPSQLENTSKTIAAGLIPGAKVVRTDQGVDIIAPDNVSSSFVEGLRIEIMNDLAKNQGVIGPAEAQRVVFQDYANNFDLKRQYITETYNAPSPPIFSAPGEEGEVLDTTGAGINSMELQESMGDIGEVEPTVSTIPSWQEGVFE